MSTTARTAAVIRGLAVVALLVALLGPHRGPSGPSAGRHANRLVHEPSPYLQQHAHNPVDWYPWGDEAFARARAGHRPVLLSIGYATCHWCHVMAEESFEDAEIAAYLNAHYVAIKVDREQRPDLDAVYLAAVQAMGQGGGWPLTVWLTPDRRPFYGGTYFPPRSGVRGQRVGFLELLQRLDETFQAEPDRVAIAAADVVGHLERAAPPIPDGPGPGTEVLRHAVAQLRMAFDPEHGGFGRAPKFPRPAALDLLLRWHRRTGDPDALSMVLHTLDAIAAGGIHDHVGGGFHRYATDAAWEVPHFEKMLYDNALLAVAYLDAARAGARPDLAEVGRDTLDWLLRDMAAPQGGFFSAIDADSDGEEGRFYLWTPQEVSAAIEDPTTVALVLAYYAVLPGGRFAGRTILHTPRPLAEVATAQGLALPDAQARLAHARDELRAARTRRVSPATDRKILTASNGLAISALARGGSALGDPRYTTAASRTAGFLLGHLRTRARLERSSFEGTTGGVAVLEDYSFLIAGLLDLFEATADPRWFREALALQTVLDARFADRSGGGYFHTADDAEALLVREKPGYDGAEPSGNSIALLNLLRLSAFTGDDRWRTAAERGFAAFGDTLARNPEALPAMTGALESSLDRAKEIVLVAPAGGDPGSLLSTVRARYLPNQALAVVTEGAAGNDLATLVPLVADKQARDGRPTAYVCERQVCQRPTTDPDQLARQLEKVVPLP